VAKPDASITITQPDGVSDVVSEGDDFATSVLGDPWDMNEYSDMLAYHGLPGATIEGGMYRLTMSSSAAEIQIYLGGIVGAMDVGKIGANYPIDTNRYRWLSFRMKHPGGNIQIKWFYDRIFTPGPREFASAQLFPATPGWHTYVLDLETIPIGSTGGGATGWNGQVWELDIVPFASTGDEILIDWVRLTADNPAGNDLTISWSDLTPVGSQVDFVLDDDQIGCDGTLIGAEGSASASGSIVWQSPSRDVASPTNVEPGEYYVCARVNGVQAGYSAGTLEVNRAPIVAFAQPGFSSGDDYATDAGNPWDMDDAADITAVQNGSASFSNGVAAVTVPASQSDVQVFLNVPTAIDNKRYHYLTYRLWFDYPYTWSVVAQVSRLFWGHAPDRVETQSGLIYVFPGWNTYTVDLRSLELSFGPDWETANWTLFRLDPIANGTGETVTFYLDDIKLTGDEEADKRADIMWTLTDPDSTDTTLDLYYDTDQAGQDGIFIAALALTDGQHAALERTPGAENPSVLHVTEELTPTAYLPVITSRYFAPCSGACYTWDTGAVPSGSYYIYGCVDDGHNELCRYSEGPLIISHP